MRRAFCLIALSFLLLPRQTAKAQARPQGSARSAPDTLPEHVVQGAVDAYKRRDVDAAFAHYDTVFSHQYLADSVGAKRFRRDDWVRLMKNDAGFLRTI